MIIENFKLIEFINQPPEVIERTMIALRYLKPIKTKREIFHMKLKHVELIKTSINSTQDEDLIKIISKVQKCKKKEVFNIPIIEFFGILNSIRKQLEVIVKAEENALKPSEINMKWEAVNGSERKAKFGILNTLEFLSNGDRTQYQYFNNLEYSEVFAILLMIKEDSDIQKDMDKIKTN